MRQIRKQKHRKMREKGRIKLSKKQIFVICGIFVIIIAIVATVWIYTSKGSVSGAERNTSADNSREEKGDSQNGGGEDKSSETDSGAEQAEADGESSASDLSGGGSMGDSGEDSEPVFQEGTYADCSATVAEIDEFEMSENQVQVEENEDQSLTITNLTDKDIPAVRIFYKFYMEEENAYVGGITYTAKVTNLKAGDSQEIIPSHYLQGSSRIIMVRTYDTTE